MRTWKIVVSVILLVSVLSLSGLAQAPKAAQSVTGDHGINITWTEGSPAGTSYNVWKSTTSGAEKYDSPPYATCPSLGYLDQTGTPGTVYYYTVTAVLNGVQSEPSGEASAAFPIIPGAPKTVTATAQ